MTQSRVIQVKNLSLNMNISNGTGIDVIHKLLNYICLWGSVFSDHIMLELTNQHQQNCILLKIHQQMIFLCGSKNYSSSFLFRSLAHVRGVRKNLPERDPNYFFPFEGDCSNSQTISSAAEITLHPPVQLHASL